MADDIPGIDNVKLAETLRLYKELTGVSDDALANIKEQLGLMLKQQEAAGMITNSSERRIAAEKEQFAFLQGAIKDYTTSIAAAEQQLRTANDLLLKHTTDYADMISLVDSSGKDQVEQLKEKVRGGVELTDSEKAKVKIITEYEAAQKTIIEGTAKLKKAEDDHLKALKESVRHAKKMREELRFNAVEEVVSKIASQFFGIKQDTSELGKYLAKFNIAGFKDFKDAFSFKGIKNAFKGFKKGLLDLGNVFKKVFAPQNVGLSFIWKVLESTVISLQDVDKAWANLAKTTGNVERYRDMVVTTHFANIKLGNSFEEVSEQIGTLHTGLSDFSEMAEPQQEMLLDTSLVFKGLGVDASAFNQAYTDITKSAGMSEQALIDMTSAAMNLDLDPAHAIKALNENSELFYQYSGPKMIEEYTKLAAASKNLGIDMGTLGKAMGQFDTFEGAANSVGRLNAMLRGPYFNTLEMLRATEADRVELLQRGLHESGLSWDTANRYQQRYIAEQAGLSVLDMGKIIRGEDTYEGLINKQQSFNGTLEELKGIATKGVTAFKKFTKVISLFAVLLQPLTKFLIWLSESILESVALTRIFTAAVVALVFAFNPVVGIIMAVAQAFAWLSDLYHQRNSPPFWQLPAAMGENMTILGDAASRVAGLLNAIVVPVFSAIYDVFHWVWEKLSKLSAFDWIGLGGAVVGLGTAFHVLRAAVVGFPLGFLGALRLSFSTLGGVLKLPYTMVTSLGAALGTLAMKIPFVSSAMTAFAARRAAETPVVAASGAAMSVWAKNIFAVGIGIGAAAAGLAYFASVMKTLEATDFGAIVFGLAIFGVAIFRLLAFLATASSAAATAAPALLPIAGIILALGAAFALAGLGIWAMGQGMVLLAEAGVEALAPLAALTAFILTTASSGLGLLLSAAALVGIAIGLGLIAAALAITDEDALSSLARMMDGLSKIGSEHASLVAGLAYMAGALEEVDEDEIDALTKLFAKLDGLQINITGLDSVVSLATSGISYELFMIAQALGAIAGAGFFLNFGAVGAIEDITEALQEVPTEKAVALASVLEHTAIAASAQVDTGALAKDMEKIASVSSNVALSLIDARKKEKKQEGVLITDKLVVNLGGGKTFEKRVVDIVNKKISPRRT